MTKRRKKTWTAEMETDTIKLIKNEYKKSNHKLDCCYINWNYWGLLFI